MELESKPAQGCEDNHALLEDLLFEEILPRLPAVSLIRFKRVSKTWFDYITNDKRLVSNNLRHQSRSTKYSAILSYSRNIRNPECQMYFVDHQSRRVSFTDIQMHMDKFVGPHCVYCLAGSCNGLVCLYIRFPVVYPEPLVVLRSRWDAVVLWNPVTGDLRDSFLPPLPPMFRWGRAGGDYPVHGLGYDECHDDYKVVRVFPTQPALLTISVFSRNSGCWRQLDKDLLGYTVCDESSESVLLNGCLYWLVLALEYSAGGTYVTKRRCVLSFNLCDEEFKIISVLGHHTPYVATPRPRRRIVKWKEKYLAFAWFPDDRPGQRNDYGFELILDSHGNAVEEQNPSTTWLNERQPFSLNGPQMVFIGVSRDRIFVSEKEVGHSMNLVTYDPLCRYYENENENVGRHEAFTYHCFTWVASPQDYVPSLVSAYPDHKTMIEEKEKMEVRYWVSMFWTSIGLTKQQFGLTLDSTKYVRIVS